MLLDAQAELLAIAKGPACLLTAKILQKHNFWQLPKVKCESQYGEIHATRHNNGEFFSLRSKDPVRFKTISTFLKSILSILNLERRE